ncbi:hypothetical protein CS0771_30690 [Catellatospora sp. IY07-71]|nr:hypothetical protein CS0771_30690 [Catellatospora sp. IY07-71]
MMVSASQRRGCRAGAAGSGVWVRETVAVIVVPFDGGVSVGSSPTRGQVLLVERGLAGAPVGARRARRCVRVWEMRNDTVPN